MTKTTKPMSNTKTNCRQNEAAKRHKLTALTDAPKHHKIMQQHVTNDAKTLLNNENTNAVEIQNETSQKRPNENLTDEVNFLLMPVQIERE